MNFLLHKNNQDLPTSTEDNLIDIGTIEHILFPNKILANTLLTFELSKDKMLWTFFQANTFILLQKTCCVMVFKSRIAS